MNRVCGLAESQGRANRMTCSPVPVIRLPSSQLLCRSPCAGAGSAWGAQIAAAETGRRHSPAARPACSVPSRYRRSRRAIRVAALVSGAGSSPDRAATGSGAVARRVFFSFFFFFFFFCAFFFFLRRLANQIRTCLRSRSGPAPLMDSTILLMGDPVGSLNPPMTEVSRVTPPVDRQWGESSELVSGFDGT